MTSDSSNFDMVGEALTHCMELGYIEIVGITPSGEWLYAATPSFKSMLDEDENLLNKLRGIYDALDKFNGNKYQS